ncbi:MAG: transcriptional repressor [Gammaproteobacteria bacterium]|nr:transcriptional repressor [Gammaproteobacteria bacterium]
MSRLDILNKFAEHTILPTPQRLEVAEVLLEKPQHLSAEQIIDRLRENGSTVSKATVYNTLKLFGERGLVKELSVDPERRFYDSTTHAHHHFYNVDTGELRDIADAELTLSSMPDLPEGTVADGVEILVKVRNR